jgi:Mor family transcriptional regulator
MSKTPTSAMSQRRDGLLDDLCTHIKDVLTELNIDDQKSDIAASEVTARIVSAWGGQHLYIPQGFSHRSYERALVIYEACNGRNHHEVAKSFDVSVRSVYRIYNRIHALVIAQNQRDMFNSP